MAYIYIAGVLHETLCKELAFEQWEAPVEPSAAGLPQALVALLAGSPIEQMPELWRNIEKRRAEPS